MYQARTTRLAKEPIYEINVEVLGKPVYILTFSTVNKTTNVSTPAYRQYFKRTRPALTHDQVFLPTFKKPQRMEIINPAIKGVTYATCGCMVTPAGLRSTSPSRKPVLSHYCKHCTGVHRNWTLGRDILEGPISAPWLNLITSDENPYTEQLCYSAPDSGIDLTEHDYRTFPNQLNKEFEVSSILEMYSFSPAVLTKDVEELFQEYKKIGLRIKWVDDTHLLLKFATDEDGKKATLKAISIRLKSVKNIQKITQSMKMVSAAKYTRAERELKMARPYGQGAKQFYEKAEVTAPQEAPQKLIIAMTSDRGLCGAVHTAVS